MNVIVIVVMVVAVGALSSTLEYSTITREKLCDQIRLNQRKILTMGTRGTSLHEAHFYILTEGGYMFKLPLANLHVDTAKKTTSVTIDRDYIRADTLFGVNQSEFKRDSKFFLISDKNRNMFVGRMFLRKIRSQGHKDKVSIRLYDLNGRQSGPIRPQDVSLDEYNRIVVASLGLYSDISYALRMDHLVLDRLYSFKAIDINGIDKTDSAIAFRRFMMDFSSTTDIVAVFYLEDSNKNGGYYYFLDSAGLVTVTRRQNDWDYVWFDETKTLYRDKFEMNLSSFILCYPKVEATEEATEEASTKVLPKQTTTNETSETDDEPETEATGISNWTIALVVGIVALVVLAIICYCTHLTIERAKVKRRGRKVRNIFSFRKKRKPDSDSDEQHSLTSKVSSGWKSVQSKITSWFGGHKKKQAKVVAKGRKGKREKKESDA